MRFNTLFEWLNWQLSLHPHEIELGLSRCRQVAQRLNLLAPNFPIINVAGTNGKGSSVALLDAILSASGLRVGRYTSPHLLHYNERIGIAGQPVSDAQLCEAFAAVEAARQEVSLTFFEFGTLAALWLFQQGENKVEIAILEVGLGGRLDAVNIFDPTIALVTAIDIDHTDWLGKDRDRIGFEKAGIFRAQRPAVCSDPQPPLQLLHHAQQLPAPLYYLGRDFSYQKMADNSWSWYSKTASHSSLPLPALPGDFQLQNAAGVLMVLELLPLALSEIAIRQGLIQVNLPARFQVLPGKVTRVLDVAHNPQAAKELNKLLQQTPGQGTTHAVMGILRDKDIGGILAAIQQSIAEWYVAPLNTPRSATVNELVGGLQTIGATRIHTAVSIAESYHQAMTNAQAGDRVVVFGSFYTVAEVLTLLDLTTF